MTHQERQKYRVVSLGCRTNQYEGQAFQDQLEASGFSLASQNEAADICIVNTCTVTEQADSASRHEIKKLKKENPNSKIIVTGCFAENHPEDAASIAGVDKVVSNKDKENLLSLVYPEKEFPEFSVKRFNANTRAFVKVQDGCNSFCSYCIIPYVRGRSRSRSLDDILKEIQDLIDNGFKEIVLTGINIGDFDGGSENPPVRLAELVRKVDSMEGIHRIRVSSIDPDEVDEDLADAILNGKKTCHSMHVVLQSGSNVILKRMNRKYTRQIFFKTVDFLRSESPDFTFTTDIIVGFPGETEIDHLDTLSAMREVRFAKVHMFPYSDRERTKASSMPNKVSPSIISRRKQEVLRLSEKLSFELRESFLGREMTVLTEKREGQGKIEGHTENFLNVLIQSDTLKPNEIVRVKLIENTPAGLIGELL
ncbi:tRNA (N(6)-L-threonylcarbamoyladenosine(37)-C(2))-methylthiotransferase MtaB [Criblamydia sequanensis]|uniref:MiaB-like tRNA modifying enzyme n=1 Tax=Candidatus Criblamydia sequanensis CRIB-18 TaxID=1437425 RepID=A0A090D0B7_9BACT|nr:tRNA (N(6)-L-threonylcarbamoyladenosine(37)-C(2))-methylthiotransferase MtaB [Criblamydia sequanensis]CDR34962.1 MiaB-like tRNA modifying enzyme [Criblamydia sequanensis CRIB-18]